jgi:hypothetical protein
VIGAILLGLVAGIVGRLLVPDMWSGLSFVGIFTRFSGRRGT